MTQTVCQTSSGLGLRRSMVADWKSAELDAYPRGFRPDFIEITPENWMGMGGRFGDDLRFFTERFPVFAHGLSLSIGGPDELDTDYIDRLGVFLNDHRVEVFSEHLSYCTDGGHLYDLMPIPFTEAAVRRLVRRIDQVQTRLGRQLVLENVSYYAAPGQEMTELEFINAVVTGADCGLLLDINNVYVNSVNHGYDPRAFIDGLPSDRVVYQHIAGHFQQSPDLIIDTHGADVAAEVWQLFSYAQSVIGPRATVLERDFNIPAFHELCQELSALAALQRGAERSSSLERAG